MTADHAASAPIATTTVQMRTYRSTMRAGMSMRTRTNQRATGGRF